MKELLLLFLLVGLFNPLKAQTYKTIFGATGETSTLDSVFVENLTKNVNITLKENFELIFSKELGLEDYIKAEFSGLNVYPNPVYGSCTFDFFAPKSGSSVITLYDISGKLIDSRQVNFLAGWQSWQLSGLGNGLYLLKVGSRDWYYSAKIMSQGGEQGELRICIEASKGLNTKSELKENGKGNEWKKSDDTLPWLAYEDEDDVIAIAYTLGYGMHYTIDPRESKDVLFEMYPCIDRQGYKYPLTKIGTQIWMAENLKVTTSFDGVDIPEVKDSEAWILLKDCARCYWLNDSATYASEYGALYNQYCVSNNVCPEGYRVPSNADWDKLIEFVGGSSVAGGFLKSRHTDFWLAPNTGAINKYGFNARGGSARSVIDGGFPSFKEFGFWWTSEEYEFRQMFYDSETFSGGGFSPKENGMSIRCIKQ